MSKGLKIFFIILAVLAALAAAAFFWGKSVWDKITFGMPRLVGLNLNGLTLKDLANAVFAGGEKEVTATLSMDVVNKNNFSIPFSRLKVLLLYNDQAIAETSNMISGKNVIPANGTFTGTDVVKIILNASGIQMLIDKITNGKVILQYKIVVWIFGIPLPKAFSTYTLEF